MTAMLRESWRASTLTLTALLLASPLLAQKAPKIEPPHDAVACEQCHPSWPQSAQPYSCTSAECHPEQGAEFRSSAHDQQQMADAEAAPDCATCHGGHATLTGEQVRVSVCERELDQACLTCHPADAYADVAPDVPVSAGFADSVHARARESAGCEAAGVTCYACHGAHTVRAGLDPGSPISRQGVAGTCGACHGEARDAFKASAHGQALESGSTVAPTCVSCHGTHQIHSPDEAEARTATLRVVFNCAECHEDPAVTRAAGLPEGSVESFERTFHGLAHGHGISDVATCVGCHGAHDVLPASDPRSRVHPDNVEATCRTCHAEVDPDMIIAASHPSEWPGFGEALRRLNLYFPVAGTALNPILVSGMGAVVGFLSGLFGVGGGFLMTPLLIFIGIPVAVAAATDAAQITAGASSGALSHSRLGNVDFKMGLVIVLGGWTGGYAGVQLVAVLRDLGNFDFFLRLVYVIVLGFIGIGMLIEGVRTLRGKSAGEPKPSRITNVFRRLPLQTHFPRSGLTTSALLPVGAGFAVGVLAAFLGVGGGFIMLPMMIYIIGIPTRVAIGTDLFQIVLTSANVTLQQALVNHTVDILLAVALFAGSVIGAQFGVIASKYLKGEQIRVFLAVIVLIVMSILLYQLLATPDNLIGFARSGGGH